MAWPTDCAKFWVAPAVRAAAKAAACDCAKTSMTPRLLASSADSARAEAVACEAAGQHSNTYRLRAR